MKFFLSKQRYFTFIVVLALTVLTFIGALKSGWLVIPFVLLAALSALGIYDVTQDKHAITRNYPLIGHFRFIFEKIRPEIRQYLIEGDKDQNPFSREQRSLVYQRAKGAEDKRPFGTQENVYEAGYGWLTHSVAPVHSIFACKSVGRIANSPIRRRYTTSLRCHSARYRPTPFQH